MNLTGRLHLIPKTYFVPLSACDLAPIISLRTGIYLTVICMLDWPRTMLALEMQLSGMNLPGMTPTYSWKSFASMRHVITSVSFTRYLIRIERYMALQFNFIKRQL